MKMNLKIKLFWEFINGFDMSKIRFGRSLPTGMIKNRCKLNDHITNCSAKSAFDEKTLNDDFSVCQSSRVCCRN